MVGKLGRWKQWLPVSCGSTIACRGSTVRSLWQWCLIKWSDVIERQVAEAPMGRLWVPLGHRCNNIGGVTAVVVAIGASYGRSECEIVWDSTLAISRCQGFLYTQRWWRQTLSSIHRACTSLWIDESFWCLHVCRLRYRRHSGSVMAVVDRR